MMSPRFWIYCVICCCCCWFADPWCVVGFNLIAASDSSYVLGYSLSHDGTFRMDRWAHYHVPAHCCLLQQLLVG